MHRTIPPPAARRYTSSVVWGTIVSVYALLLVVTLYFYDMSEQVTALHFPICHHFCYRLPLLLPFGIDPLHFGIL